MTKVVGRTEREWLRRQLRKATLQGHPATPTASIDSMDDQQLYDSYQRLKWHCDTKESQIGRRALFNNSTYEEDEFCRAFVADNPDGAPLETVAEALGITARYAVYVSAQAIRKLQGEDRYNMQDIIDDDEDDIFDRSKAVAIKRSSQEVVRASALRRKQKKEQGGA